VAKYVAVVRAYKFLDEHGRAPFTATPWRAGEWVEAARAEPCHQGVHACRPTDLAHWLAATLWEVELDEPFGESRHKIVAARGRLVAPVDHYAIAVRELSEIGAWRSRDRAVEAVGVDDRVTTASTLTELMALGALVDDSTFAGRSAALAADAAYFAEHGLASQSPFVAACSAGHAASGPNGDQTAYDAGYAAERVFQSAWLADRLGLIDGVAAA